MFFWLKVEPKYLSHSKLLQRKLDLLKQVAVSGRQKLVKDLEHPDDQESEWANHKFNEDVWRSVRVGGTLQQKKTVAVQVAL